VNKIRDQCQKQEDTLKEQEGELDSKRSELQKLKDEENSLNKQYDEGLNELQTLSKNLQDTQLEISQVRCRKTRNFGFSNVRFSQKVRLMLSQLEENQRQMNDARSMFRMAIESDNPNIVSEYTLQLEPEFQEAKRLLEDVRKLFAYLCQEVMNISQFIETKGGPIGGGCIGRLRHRRFPVERLFQRVQVERWLR
jgi:epidermal growth factor receptor substrate 15